MSDTVGIVLTIGFIALTFVFATFIARRVNQSQRPSDVMLENGIRGKATIQKISQTGLWVNENPQVHFVLNVQPPSDPAYQAEVDQIIQVIDVPLIQPGMEALVLIDPENNQKLSLVLR